jgi:hypothetical protein
MFLFSKKNRVRYLAFRIIHWTRFESLVLLIIIVSSLKLAVDTYLPSNPNTNEENQLANLSQEFDIVFNSFFIAEAVFKITALGFAFGEGAYLTGKQIFI